MSDISKFQSTVWSYYRANKRDMPWRRDHRLYYVVVSEIMLQQTQVPRVLVKFASWMKKFPDWKSLAKASVKDVLTEWSGLGYNRRALYLKKIASHFPQGKWAAPGLDPHKLLMAKLRELPGIGPNTAGSILVFAFNLPVPFIETNIRSAYLHHFFARSRAKISDEKIMPLIEASLKTGAAKKNPREWYYAIMDYGSHLKATQPNPSRKSAHHVKQSAFKGSNRELRSKILRLIMKKPQTKESIERALSPHDKQRDSQPTDRISRNIEDLMREGFIEIARDTRATRAKKNAARKFYRIV